MPPSSFKLCHVKYLRWIFSGGFVHKVSLMMRVGVMASISEYYYLYDFVVISVGSNNLGDAGGVGIIELLSRKRRKTSN